MRPAAAYGAGEVLGLPFAAESVPWFGGGRFVSGELQPGSWLEHAAGMYYVQDAASMLALRLLDVQPSEVVADVCAAPGGKASAILEITGPGGGFLLANEPVHSRLGPLTLSMARVGYPGYAISSVDPQELAGRLKYQFDAVLVDAPVPGSHWFHEDVSHCLPLVRSRFVIRRRGSSEFWSMRPNWCSLADGLCIQPAPMRSPRTKTLWLNSCVSIRVGRKRNSRNLRRGEVRGRLVVIGCGLTETAVVADMRCGCDVLVT